MIFFILSVVGKNGDNWYSMARFFHDLQDFDNSTESVISGMHLLVCQLHYLREIGAQLSRSGDNLINQAS